MLLKQPGALGAEAVATAVAVLALCLAPRSATAQAARPHASVTIERPKARTVDGGSCRILSDGTFSATFPPDALPTLGFTIGPKATMAAEMHASLAPFKGPGTYKDEILAVYLGKTVSDESYGGLGAVTINPDGHSGTFTTKDGKAAGHFDCGAVPTKP
jgi:hypothetical protein